MTKSLQMFILKLKACYYEALAKHHKFEELRQPYHTNKSNKYSGVVNKLMDEYDKLSNEI